MKEKSSPLTLALSTREASPFGRHDSKMKGGGVAVVLQRLHSSLEHFLLVVLDIDLEEAHVLQTK